MALAEGAEEDGRLKLGGVLPGWIISTESTKFQVITKRNHSSI